MKKPWMIIITLSFFMKLHIPSIALPSFGIEPSASYILVEAKTNLTILEQRADIGIRPASTTKIMTAILALEHGRLQDPMVVSQRAVFDIGPGGMHIGIKEGESTFTLEHMLNVMLIRSGNETANIIAENVGGTYGNFIELMNQKAIELGASNTFFVNPNGKDHLEAENDQLTTARDMATLARFAMNIPIFKEIVKKPSYRELPSTNFHDDWPILMNTNRLLLGKNQFPYEINGSQKHYVVTGIKTGYTSKAGGNLIASAKNDEGIELIVSVMNVKLVPDTFSYAQKLFEYGFKNISSQQIIQKNQVVKTISVEINGQQETLDLLAAEDLIIPLPSNIEMHHIDFTEHISQPTTENIQKGDVFGFLEAKKGESSLGSIHLLAARDLTRNPSSHSTKKVIPILPILSIGLVLIAISLRKLFRIRSNKL
jgi:serine-type D-Ala-D-Ala carboxypeptidase (penicillin-binding protein 5/6)